MSNNLYSFGVMGRSLIEINDDHVLIMSKKPTENKPYLISFNDIYGLPHEEMIGPGDINPYFLSIGLFHHDTGFDPIILEFDDRVLLFEVLNELILRLNLYREKTNSKNIE